MPQVQANGLTIEYESFGNPAAPPILLIMGLGGQLILWPDKFCEQLAQAGYHVIRFDNRDVGLSEKIEHAWPVTLMRAGIFATLGIRVRAPYTLDDMALDALGLMDALDLPTAHVVGVSMGGMIGQLMAARHGARVRSLTCVMTTSGNRRLPGPTFPLRLRLVSSPRLPDRESRIRYSMQTWRMIGSPAFPAEESELRAKVERSIDRSLYPRGLARQTLAILASGSRVRLLPQIKAPTLILHGKEDPLVPVAHAHDLAKHIPGSRLETIAGWGHDLPTQLMPRIAERILDHAGSVDEAVQGRSGLRRAV